MAPEMSGLRVVATYAGNATGETISVTEDGRHWTNERVYCGTGQSVGTYRNGRIENIRSCECGSSQRKPEPPPTNRHERRAAAKRKKKRWQST